jgi:hypothetical protein
MTTPVITSNVGGTTYSYSNSTYGQPVGTTTTYTTTQPVTNTYTTTVAQPVSTTYVAGTSGYGVNTGYSTVGVNGYGTASGVAHQPQVVNTVVNTGKEVIKGESRIEYVPFEKKIIEYKENARVERVPKTRKVTEYRE